LKLPSGNEVEVTRRLVAFEEWKGDRPNLPRIWSRKGYLNYEGEALFAELVIRRMLEKEGWESVWVNNFGRKEFLKGLPRTRSFGLSLHAQETFDRIVERNGGRQGCWDVFAFRDGQKVFVEAKRARKDHIKKSQRAWLEAARDVGVPLDAFSVVEWDLA